MSDDLTVVRVVAMQRAGINGRRADVGFLSSAIPAQSAAYNRYGMSLQESLAGTLTTLRLWNAVRRFPALAQGTFVILGYHRIANAIATESYSFDPELISATTAEFDWQMDFVRSEFTVLPLLELLERSLAGRPIPPRAVAITFDDGFTDNHDVALPVLRKHSIPATVFVSTEWIDRQQPIWFEVCAYACMRLAPASLLIEGLPQLISDGASYASRRAATRQLLKHLKTVPNEARLKIVAQLRDAVAGAEFDRDWRSNSAPLTWDKIREMSRHGVDFGSHSVSHPILARSHDAQITFEVTDSRARLREELGRDVDLLAYPVGGSGAFDARVVNAARAAGYRFGVSYIAGANRTADFDPFSVRRHHVEIDTSRARFEAQLSLPTLFK